MPDRIRCTIAWRAHPGGLDQPIPPARSPAVRSRWIGLIALAACVAGLGLRHDDACAERVTIDEPAHAVHEARGRGGMVVGATRTASEAGRDVLTDGGSAVDAAVAVAFALAVSWPEAGNIGGGGFMMVHAPSGESVCVDYRECAPRNANPTMYTPNDSVNHPKAVGVPGTVRGLAKAHARFGKLPWRRLVEPAVALARDGFEVDRHLAASLNSVLSRDEVRSDPRCSELRRVYGRADGKPWSEGDRIVLPDLAATLQAIAENGPDAFYGGSIARRLADDMKASGGWITDEDLRAYEAIVRTPIEISYRGFRILAPPPPSSGGICLGLILGMLEPRHLAEKSPYGAEAIHLTAEAMRRAFLERARYIGDPAFAPIPDRLRSKEHAIRLGDSIDERRATSSSELGADILEPHESSSTTHFSVIDGEGLAVSNTYTLEAPFGSRVVVPGTGFLLNNEMGDFNWFPGATNATGRIGTPANTVAPGKRMLSSQTPVIVLKDGRPYVLTGSPGGRTIINTVASILLNVLEFEMDFAQAIAAPRVHHQWMPDRLDLESGPRITDATAETLRAMGHSIGRPTIQGSAHSIRVDPVTGEYHGVADWRRGGFASGLDARPARADK